MLTLTQRLAATLEAHRHLKGPRVLCDAQGDPLAEHHVTDLLQRAARLANLRNNGPHIPALVLFTPGDARRAHAGNSGARGTPRPDDDATLRAPEPERD